MSIIPNVATILKDHVTLEVEGINRMYLNVYIPRLQILEVEKSSHDCILAEEVFQQINRPARWPRNGLPLCASPIRRSNLLWNALLLFPLLPSGFSHRDLREHLASLLAQLPEQLTPGQMTYHLRRLR